jgi:hypothetical protein
MSVGTYSIGNSIRGLAGGGGLGLAGMASDQQQQAMTMLGQAAQQQAAREQANKVARQQQKQGAAGLAASGAMTGLQVSGGNPWGAVIGGVVGYFAGGGADFL